MPKQTLPILTRLQACFPAAMAGFCLAFGLCLILNVNLAGDGTWYWYARAYNQGEKVYSSLGFAQQPLYLLLKAWEIQLFGASWIASKALSLLTLLLFMMGIYRLVRRLYYSDFQKGILIAAIFFIGIHFEAYRFDDYHALVDALVLLVCDLLLLARREPTLRPLQRAIGLGVLGGLASACRLNDGVLLLVTSSVVLYVFIPRHRWRYVGALFAAAAVVILGVHLCVHDSWSAWWHCSISGGAAAKGGLAQLLLYVFMLPVHAMGDLATPASGLALLQIAGSQALIFCLWKAKNLQSIWKVPLGAALFCTFTILPFHMYRDPVIVVSAMAILALTLALGIFGWGCIQRKWSLLSRPDSLVLLIPMGLWISGAMSSGGWHYGLYFPFALFLLITFAIIDIDSIKRFLAIPIFSMLAFLSAFGMLYRYYNPCSWQSYQSAPMFQNRILIRDNKIGIEYIDKNMFNFFSDIEKIIQNAKPDDILSIPMPYVNYFKGIAPWKNYVQTFFDTSSEKLIAKLTRDLGIAPPRWILYQRQLDNLVEHENTFNGGQPLPHRKLDEMILHQLQHRIWSVKGQWIYGRGSVWILIDTNAPAIPQVVNH